MNHARLYLGDYNSAHGIRSGLDWQIMGYTMWKSGDPNYTSNPLPIEDIRRVR